MKVSIGIPFYNPGKHFKAAINSVLAQSFQDFELLLINDGSTDESLQIAQSFKDPRIKIFNDGKNKGLPTRLNELISLSSGEYIARMDADDIISPNRIRLQVEALDNTPEIDIVSTGICSLNNAQQIIGYRLPVDDLPHNFTTKQVIFGQADIAHATILARSTWYKRNRYNEQAKLMEDYQLWIDAAIKDDLKVLRLAKPMYFYREEESVSPKKSINAYKNQLRLVLSQYATHLTRLEKWQFISSIILKIVTSKVLNLLQLQNILIALRNRNTTQQNQSINDLQTELKRILK